MAWSASVAKVEKPQGRLWVTVTYTNGVETFAEVYRRDTTPPAEWLEKVVEARIAQLVSIEAAVVALGPIGKPKPPPEPEPVDLKRQAFRANVGKAQRLANVVALGSVVKTDLRVVDLAAAIATDIDLYWGDL